MRTKYNLNTLPNFIMARFFTLMLAISGIWGLNAEAQQVKIGSGVHFVNGVKVNTGSIVNQGTINNGPTVAIELTGNWENNGSYTANTGSLVTFSGNTPQEIGGNNATTFGNLTLSNNTGFSISNNVVVNGTLDFQQGILNTGNYLVTIGGTGGVSNAKATSFVEGKFANTFVSAASRQFPIGKDGNYRPITLQFSALSGTSTVTAEQFETPLTGTLPADVTLMSTGRRWTLSQSGGSNMQYFITLDATDYTPTRPVVILKQDNGTMESCPTVAPDYTNSAALTTFSEFGLGEVCKNPTHAGTLTGAQTGCGPFDPGQITGTLPTGHSGIIEYKWQESTISDATGFSEIANTNTKNYDPGALIVTTWFRRLARVDCKTNWTGAAESNVVKIEVDVTPPVVVIKSGATVALNPLGVYTFLPDDVLSSYTDAGVGIKSVTIVPASVDCSQLGLKTVTVTVKDDCDNQTVVTPQITVVEGSGLAPWVNANTAPAANGSATYSPCTNNGTFRLTATGQSSNTNDVFHFVYDTIETVGTIIARLDDIDNGGWAGVMMRESLEPNAKTVLFKTRLYNPNVIIGYRTTQGSAMRNLSQVAQLIHWMKIQRNGNTFQVFTSYNGTTWLRRYTGTISMGTEVLAGVFTESILSNRTSVAWFDNVELSAQLKTGDEFAEAEIINLDSEQAEVSVYPNPAKDEVNITLKGFRTLEGFGTLLTTDGKTVKTFTISESETQLNVQDLMPGVYILRVENAENVVVKRLVIQ